MCHRVLLRPGRSPENILVVTWGMSVTQRCALSLYRLLGLGMSIMRAKAAFLKRFVVGHHAVVVDPGESAGAMLEGERRLV